MLTVDQQLALRNRIAQWSDLMERPASALAEKYQHLLGRRIGNSQLSGLTNIVASAPTFEDVKQFVKHQRQKADLAGHPEVKEYWDVVGRALLGLEEEAWKLANEVGLPIPPKESKPKEKRLALDWLYRRLAGEYVQHLVAHSLFVTKQRF